MLPRRGPQDRRLRAAARGADEHQDGFKLSEVDLAIRGEGTLFGSRQSGMPDLKVAKLLRDMDVLVEARREAFALVARGPTLKQPDHRPLRREIRDLLGADVEWLFRELGIGQAVVERQPRTPDPRLPTPRSDHEDHRRVGAWHASGPVPKSVRPTADRVRESLFNALGPVLRRQRPGPLRRDRRAGYREL